MLEEKINELRKELNQMMVRENEDPKKILQVSEKLDVLILEYYEGIGLYKQ